MTAAYIATTTSAFTCRLRLFLPFPPPTSDSAIALRLYASLTPSIRDWTRRTRHSNFEVPRPVLYLAQRHPGHPRTLALLSLAALVESYWTNIILAITGAPYMKLQQILAKSIGTLRRLSRSRLATDVTLTHREILEAGNAPSEPSKKYLQRVELLDNVVRDCITVSQQYAGIASPTGRHFYASVLFTSLIGRGLSLLILAPQSPWAQKLIEHWDYASSAIIVRTMIEIRGAFHYLCVDRCSEVEWDCRWNLLNLHDCVTRKRLLEARGDNPDEIKQLQEQADELRGRLRNNLHFATVSHKQKLLNGQTAYLYSLEEILQKAGIEKSVYRWQNILFSSHVHGLPLSYYRMGSQERGKGLPSPIEEDYTSLCLSLAANLLVRTRDDAHKLFDGLTKAEPAAGTRYQ